MSHSLNVSTAVSCGTSHNCVAAGIGFGGGRHDHSALMTYFMDGSNVHPEPAAQVDPRLSNATTCIAVGTNLDSTPY